MAWILVGTIIGARIYFVVQNDFVDYLSHPWRIVAIWEGGLAFFGGLAGGILGAYLYARKHGLSFLRLGDLFAPANLKLLLRIVIYSARLEEYYLATLGE